MAKGAASKGRMAELHNKVALVMIRVLETYLSNMDRIGEEPDEDEMIADALAAENLMPSPAMLTAIVGFLKHNDISFEEEEIDRLRDLKDQLADKRAMRTKRISDIPIMGEC